MPAITVRIDRVFDISYNRKNGGQTWFTIEYDDRKVYGLTLPDWVT